MDNKLTGKLKQIAVAVNDLEAAADFYVEALGVTRLFAAPNVVALETSGVRLLLTHRPDYRASEESGVLLYFQAQEIESVHKRLIEGGVPDRGQPHCVANLPHADIWIAFIADPSGNMVGLIEERASA